MPGCFKVFMIFGIFSFWSCNKSETWPKGYNRKEWLELPVRFQTGGYLSLDDSGKDVSLPRVMKTEADLKKYNVVKRFHNVDIEQCDIVTIRIAVSSYRKIVKIEPRYFINFELEQFHLSEGVETEKTDYSTSQLYSYIYAFVPNIPDGYEWIDGD